MIEEIRPGQTVEFDVTEAAGALARHDGDLKRYVVLDHDEHRGLVSLAEASRHQVSFPADVVRSHMIVVQEPDRPASVAAPVTKDDVFLAVCRFLAHERECVQCQGETEASDPSRRLKHLCREGREILAWRDPARPVEGAP